MSMTPSSPRGRSIQITALGTVALTIAVLFLILYMPLRWIILNNFTRIETERVQTDIERVRNALDNTLMNVARTTRDYAHWDDTFDYTASADPAYTEGNLDASAFDSLQMDLIIIFDAGGTPLFAQYLSDGALVPVQPEFLRDYGATLQRLPSSTSSITGVVRYAGSPLLIASYPVLNTAEDSPQQGTMVMGRQLNAANLQRIKQTTQLNLDLYSIDASDVPADVASARSQLSAANRAVINPLSSEQIAGYTSFADINGRDTFVVRLIEPRTIFDRAQTALSYTSLALLGTGLILAIVVAVVLRWLVLRRLIQIDSEMEAITAHPEPSARLPISGNDEITRLSTTINTMLDAIVVANSERQQADRDRQQLQNSIIEMQRESLARLSVPLIPITDTVVVMPLIGEIDQSRSERIMNTLLAGINSQRARIAILDITGLEIIDIQVALLIKRLGRAAQLVGAKVALTGMRSEVAQMLLDLEITLENIPTYSTLQQGIRAALAQSSSQLEGSGLRR